MEDVEGCREVEGRKGVKETTIEGEEAQVREESQMVQAQTTTATDANGQHTTNDTDDSPRPEPPPTPLHPSPPSPNHYEQQDDDDDTETSKTPTQRHADALHDPGGKMKESPSVRLEGERDMETSQDIELTDVETNDVNAEEDEDDHQPSRNPVGTIDGDEHCPSKPTEPPDKKEGERGANGKLRRIKGVEDVKDVELRELR
ncbi:hypothetical protein BDN67DRAFT_1010770 [Paxillus ammoniavirescens]|nr:hypothetical protein BDN67DRAFT_1010770 [Paxillus ammoniavirescens]